MKSNQQNQSKPETEEIKDPNQGQTGTGTTQEQTPETAAQQQANTPHFESQEGRDQFKTPPIDPVPTNQGEKKEEMVSVSQVNDIVAQAVAKALSAQAKASEESAKVAVAEEKKSTWPYGNKDKKKEFDLSKKLNWGGFPTDKIVAVNRAWNRDAKGNRTTTDVDASEFQVFEPLDYQANQRVTNGSGLTIYNMLGYEWEPINVPDGLEWALTGPAINN